MNRQLVFFTILFISRTVASFELPADCPEPSNDSAVDERLAGDWFSKGIDLAAAEDFERAEPAFRCSNQLIPHPATLLNVANAARHRGDTETVLAVLEEFLRLYPTDAKASAVRAEIQSIRGTEPEPEAKDAPAAIDGIAAGAEAQGPSAPLPQGEKKNKVAVSATDAPEESDTVEDDPLDALRVAGWISFALGAASCATGIATGATALSYDGDLATVCDDGLCEDPYHDKVDKMNRLGIATDVLLGVGASAAAMGIGMLIVAKIKSVRKEAASSVSAFPQAAAGFAGVGIRGAF